MSSSSDESAVVPVLDSIEPPAASEVSVLDSIEPPGASEGAVREVSVLDSLEPPAPSCSAASEVLGPATRGKRVRVSPDPVPSTSGGASTTSAVRELVQLRAGPAEDDPRPSKRTHLYSSEVLSFWNMERIITELGTDELCLRFCEERGLIRTAKNCSHHRSPMSLTDKGSVGTFRCYKARCRNPEVSRSRGTWFEDVKLPLPIIFRLMYCYAMDYDYYQTRIECSTAARDVAVSEATICDWFNYCRETIVVYELEHMEEKEKIGGKGKIVQIDESKFGKRKYNRGRRVEGHWVLGMIDDETNELRLEVCPENVRTAEVLVPLIKKHVKEGTTIHTDCWKAYDCLPDHGYIHKKVNHSDPDNPFVAPDGTHTQHIESQWRNLKKRFHKVNYKENFEDWLIEYIWRLDIKKKFKSPFEELIKAIIYVYKIYFLFHLY